MADIAHSMTDKEIERMERHLSAIYSRAEKELSEKADRYFERFRKMDEEKRKLLDAGKITQKEYDAWRKNKMMTGRHWTEMKRQAAHRLAQADQEAADYINGRLPSVYSLNYNAVADGLETRLRGYSFELVDASTVRNLATQDKTLLPYKYIDGAKAERWHTQRVNAEVLQGILQGESIPKIAKRLRDNVGMSARGSAVRNARTAVTSAENKGRMDMLHDAEEKGVKAEKGWLAAHDARVRESHAQVDGEFVGIDKEFSNGLQFPGDPDGRPEEVYNCRCTLIYKVVGFGVLTGKTDQFIPRGITISADEYGRDVSGEYVKAVSDRYESGTEIGKRVYDKYVPDGGVVSDYASKGTPCYSPDSESIYMDYKADLLNKRGAGTTWFHEHGHFVDYAAGKVSENDDFLKAIKLDVKNFEGKIKEETGFRNIADIRFFAGSKIAKERELSHSVSDIFGGAIKKPYPMTSYSHTGAYWKNQGTYGVTREAFAHMFEAQFSPDKQKIMEKYLPTAWAKFNELLGGML